MENTIQSEESKPDDFLLNTQTDEFLKALAIDIFEGKVYTNRHISNPEDIAMVFMVIALGGFAHLTEEQVKRIGLVYEYISEAGPRSINGMPSFFSMKMLSMDDTNRMLKFYNEYKQLKESFINKPTT